MRSEICRIVGRGILQDEDNLNHTSYAQFAPVAVDGAANFAGEICSWLWFVHMSTITGHNLVLMSELRDYISYNRILVLPHAVKCDHFEFWVGKWHWCFVCSLSSYSVGCCQDVNVVLAHRLGSSRHVNNID